MRARKAAKKTSQAPVKQVGICFTIMPFGGWHDKYYESVYKPAIEAADLTAHRADDLYRPSDIIQDIWGYTNRASVLLADLTNRNPNVFYELGLAHALAKPVVLVADSMESVPFDLRGLRTLIYDRNAPEWGRDLKASITSSLREVLASPESAVPPVFLHVRAEAPKSVSPHEKELLQIRSDLDALKKQVGRSPVSLRSGVSGGSYYVEPDLSGSSPFREYRALLERAQQWTIGIDPPEVPKGFAFGVKPISTPKPIRVANEPKSTGATDGLMTDDPKKGES